MKLSKAVRSDAKSLFKIEQEVFKNDNMALSLRSFYYHLKNSIIYKVEVDKKTVAYILWLKRKEFFRLYSFAVLKEYRNLGLASNLLTFSFKNLEKKKMQLEVRKSNKKAVTLYTKFGFKKIKELKNYYEDEDGILMRLER
ncbi:GNAT family N-acetyltransferase [Halarcobacter anaerophilus]|uniref:GNAT family N-acetyltransferase n=1 Tax=Halarcobacter anaerophilus TaxID=877500 RepID=A0A4Q0XWP8_9BACT|nr:GNAT family N-acetyltransferase [Halarcobacter anaerophilus]QDF28350.1 ribosomal-protein-S18-alanine N-acetyltransferase [Halarcobacter anaerophilus]RXJ61986.1 GNAT family N-acetyltransferase [Halarcobacter anaerophilus]